ncbi:hypothetical protein FRC02_004000 [Tulasnella sp. 418]|nr:hypothetical protein FRC02_004000 [Tulasnella sp. 418]
MKSDVIHKRSRHEVRGTTGLSSSPTPPARCVWLFPPQQQQQCHSPYDPLNGVGSSYSFGNSLQGGHFAMLVGHSM